ncbi:S1 family peptidase [Streptomyces sp. NPDC000594]|uniref:S1 family peptidase n=1 Tax=Streptomyces sp. NPDC000594 TaxID=3154261 RepID=UPI003325F57F
MRRTFRTVLCAAATAVCAAVSVPASAAPSAPSAEQTPRAAVVRGGDTIYSSGVACTVGFNVRRNNVYYALVAPHCANIGVIWYADAARTIPLGHRVAVTTQAGIIQYTNPAVSHPGEVNLLNGTIVDITAAASGTAGQPYCHVGQVSGTRCGTLGPAPTACSAPGDAGGPAFSGTTAIGLIATNNGTCPTGTSTYWPILAIVNGFGLSVY